MDAIIRIMFTTARIIPVFLISVLSSVFLSPIITEITVKTTAKIINITESRGTKLVLKTHEKSPIIPEKTSTAIIYGTNKTISMRPFRK